MEGRKETGLALRQKKAEGKGLSLGLLREIQMKPQILWIPQPWGNLSQVVCQEAANKLKVLDLVLRA